MSNENEPAAPAGKHLETHPMPRTSRPTMGEFKAGYYANQAGKREYRLYVPDGYNGQRVPLLIMLHGCGQTPEDFALGTRMNSFADEHTFLVAYPSQSSSANRARCWNWFRPVDQRRGNGEPAIIAGITLQIISTYSVDPDRIYVAGVSAGAAMAVIMGATYPDLYAAVGVHSGVAYASAHSVFSGITTMRRGGPDPRRQPIRSETSTAEIARNLPLILFHGDRDRLVDKINAEQIIAQWLAARTGGTDGQRGSRTDDLRIDVVQSQAPGGYSYTRTVYYDPQERAVMEKWIIHQAGHAWVGGDARAMYTDPLGPNASAEMVRFFLGHPRQ
jgi:poly(hydroxyalkanoate) depolymerase family esterase